MKINDHSIKGIQNMKTCLIYGHNGLDLDVTLNLRSLYRQLGFKVFFSDKLLDADLLVVVRAVDKPININVFSFLQVHVFDYGGWDYDSFVNSINHKITYIFCTSELKRIRLINLLNFPESQVYIALPPVDTNIWSKKIKEVQYEIVHIGNYKPINEVDSIKVRFNEILSYFKINVWGLGWQLDTNLYHSKVGLFDVSNIYSSSKYALGLMYPFQRDVTFSGRFWHAPLNGCCVFSEKGLYTSKIPGVIETDYTIEDFEHKSSIKIDRFALQEESIKFWATKNRQTISLISEILDQVSFNSLGTKKYLIYFFYFLHNTFREFYQKFSLFKLIDSPK
jgi:hypothetical protein